MKLPISVIVLGFCLSNYAHAQQSEIIDLLPGGTITWTNSQTNVYCGIEWTVDLNYTWTPLIPPSSDIVTVLTDPDPTWDILVTSAVTQVTIAEFSITWIAMENLTEVVGGNPNQLFFRVVSSPQHLAQRYQTNHVRITNASTSTLSSVAYGIQSGGSREQTVDMGDLPAGSVTPYAPLTMPYPDTQSTLGSHGFYMTYSQAGVLHDYATGVFIPFGPKEKNITISVNNNSYTITIDWTQFSRTWTY